MAFTLEVPFQSSFTTSKGAQEVFAFLSNWDKSVAQLFPGLQEFKPKGDAYEWRFNEIGYQSTRLALHFVTRTSGEAPLRLEARSAPTDPHRMDLQWRLTPQGNSTRVELSFKLAIDLALSGFLKPVITGFAKPELERLLQEYVQHVAKALEA